MNEAVNGILRRLTHVTGVRGAMVVDAEAGVPVASDLTAGVGEVAMAALAGSLYRRTTDASETAGFGPLGVLQLEAEQGHLLVAGAGDLLIVALTEPSAQLGLVRVQAARAAKELMQ